MCKSVYIAATSQNDGKTTVSIGLLSRLLEQYQSVGFIKPVGQQCIDINNNKVDKDRSTGIIIIILPRCP